MSPWAARSILLMLVTAAACTEPPVQPPTQTAPAATPAPVAADALENEAVGRADALVEDLKRREAAQAKFDRENPLPAASPVPASLPFSSPTPTAVVASPVAEAPAGPAAVAPSHDEAWWKQQRQSLQQVLDAALAQLAEAEKNNLKYGYNDAQALYKKQVAAVAAARQAIDQLHDDARRAGVPPSWLR